MMITKTYGKVHRFFARQAVASECGVRPHKIWHNSDNGDDTEVKRPKSQEVQEVTEVKVLPHERWRKLGNLIQGIVVRRCLKGMWKLRSP